MLLIDTHGNLIEKLGEVKVYVSDSIEIGPINYEPDCG